MDSINADRIEVPKDEYQVSDSQIDDVNAVTKTGEMLRKHETVDLEAQKASDKAAYIKMMLALKNKEGK